VCIACGCDDSGRGVDKPEVTRAATSTELCQIVVTSRLHSSTHILSAMARGCQE
jgi:hypothetical protein